MPNVLTTDMARRHDISTARIYTWRNKLRQPPALTEFAEAVVDDGEQQNAHQAAMPVIIVDLGGKGRVSISFGSPEELTALAGRLGLE